MLTVLSLGETQWLHVAPAQDYHAITVVPSSGAGAPRVVLAHSATLGLDESTDDGLRWSRVSPSLARGVNGLVFTANSLFATTNQEGVLRSSDRGSTWISSSNGLPVQTNENQSTVWLRPLAVIGSDIFVGGVRGVFRSTNNGASWTSVGTAIKSDISRVPYTSVYGAPPIIAFAISDDYLFAAGPDGIYCSMNRGRNWADITEGLPVSRRGRISAIVAHGNKVFAAFESDGVFLSQDDGRSWKKVTKGLTNMQVMSLAVAGNIVFAGTTNAGVFMTNDDGATWTPVRTNFPKNWFVCGLLPVGDFLIAQLYGNGTLFRRSIPEILDEARKGE